MVDILTQRVELRPFELSQKVVDLNKSIDDLYKHWNHYDILPDVCDLLRRKSDVVSEQFLIREAIASLSKAIIFDPLSGVNFSMRGRRYINVGEFERALADFAMASRLIPENWYVWYHLGLCSLIVGEYERALHAYQQCAAIPTTLSLKVALKNWQWITYMRMGRAEDAARVLEDVDASWDLDGTDNYLRLLLLYRGEMTPEDAMKVPEGDDMPVLSAATQGFGLANYFRVKGDSENYKKTLDWTIDIGKDEAWTCFGWAASEYERNRID